MGNRNNTNVPDFIHMGLKDSEAIQWLLFMLFLLICLITVLGNTGMILKIHLDFQLHTSMYFFLSHLSFLDLSYPTVILPKTLENLLPSNKYISFMGWFIQMYLFVFLCDTEFCLLSSMAYDHYVAIYNPLHYPVVMSMRLITAPHHWFLHDWLSDSLVNVLCMNIFHYCKSNAVHHFFCDLIPFLAISCTDTNDVEIMIFILTGATVMVSLFTISVPYEFILFTILKINSTSGEHKAVSTCASCLLRVTIFYGTVIFTYLKPSKSYSLGTDLVASVFYTTVVPMLNPFIYSLSNKEVKNALIRVTQKREVSSQLK